MILGRSKRRLYGKRKKPLNKRGFLRVKSRQLKKSPTEAEAVFARKLQEARIKYVFQYEWSSRGFSGIADFFVNGVLIEIDGGYHLEEDQKQVDRVKDFICQKYLRKPVLRLTNKQAMYLSIEQLVALMKEARDKRPRVIELDKYPGQFPPKCNCGKIARFYFIDSYYCKNCIKPILKPQKKKYKPFLTHPATLQDDIKKSNFKSEIVKKGI